MSRRPGLSFLAALLLCAPAAAQSPQIAPIPDPVKIPLSEVAYVHPLWKPLDAPAKLVDRPAPADLKTRTTLFTTLRVDENGKITEGQPVQPPLDALAAAATTLMPRWRFSPAMRAGARVVTWTTFGLDLEVQLEEASWSAFSLLPVAKDQPLEVVPREYRGEDWLTRYPREIAPRDPAAYSVEDVDVLPAPEKVSWSFSSTRARARVVALVEVSSTGAVKRVVPAGVNEPLVVTWVRQNTSFWRLTPAQAGGRAVDCWMSLDGTLEYTIDDAREKGKRSMKKNLRAAPPA